MARLKPQLTRQELAIMKIVWRRGSVTVRDVYEVLLEQRHVAYTTVMTMMRILEGKGHLKKNTTERAFTYKAAGSERAVVGSLVRDFVNRVFDGASQPLLLHLIKDGGLSDAERDELVRMIAESQR